MLVGFGHAGMTEQLGGLAVVGAFTIVMTIIIIVVTRLITPLRVFQSLKQVMITY